MVVIFKVPAVAETTTLMGSAPATDTVVPELIALYIVESETLMDVGTNRLSVGSADYDQEISLSDQTNEQSGNKILHGDESSSKKQLAASIIGANI